MKSKNLIRNGDASKGLADWTSNLVDVVTGERMETTNIDPVTGVGTPTLVENPAFRLKDDLGCKMSQKVQLSKRTDHLEVTYQYLTARNNHLAHEVTIIIEYALGNTQRHIMPMRDDYRPLEQYKPFKAKKPSGAGTPIPRFMWTEADTFMVIVEWIEHYSYIQLLPNQEVVRVALEVSGLDSSGMSALLDTIELTYNFDREEVAELTYVTIPAGLTEMPVFASVTDQSITDVYIMPTEAIDGASNPVELHLIKKAKVGFGETDGADEVISTLTYTELFKTKAFEVVEFGNVEYVLGFGEGVTLKAISGTLPQSTLVISWNHEAPVGELVDET